MIMKSICSILMQAAHNIFEEGLKRYMTEPVYILE